MTQGQPTVTINIYGKLFQLDNSELGSSFNGGKPSGIPMVIRVDDAAAFHLAMMKPSYKQTRTLGAFLLLSYGDFYVVAQERFFGKGKFSNDVSVRPDDIGPLLTYMMKMYRQHAPTHYIRLIQRLFVAWNASPKSSEGTNKVIADLAKLTRKIGDISLSISGNTGTCDNIYWVGESPVRAMASRGTFTDSLDIYIRCKHAQQVFTFYDEDLAGIEKDLLIGSIKTARLRFMYNQLFQVFNEDGTFNLLVDVFGDVIPFWNAIINRKSK